MDDLPRKRLTIADLRPITRLPEPPPRPAPKPPTPPRVPGQRTEAQRAARRRWRAKREPREVEVLALLTNLGERYPAMFGTHCRPLAIGCHHTIQANLGCDPKVLGVALRRWCIRDAYRAAVAADIHRYGLDGTPVAELTAEDRDRAVARLAAAQAAYKQRHKAAPA